MILVPALLGIVLSAYALHVVNASQRPGYSPLCDLSDHVSCTKALLSPYGRTFGLHNAIWGVLYYGLLLLAGSFLSAAVLPLAIVGVLASIYLAFRAYVTQRTFCIVCTLAYILNGWILSLALGTP